MERQKPPGHTYVYIYINMHIQFARTDVGQLNNTQTHRQLAAQTEWRTRSELCKHLRTKVCNETCLNYFQFGNEHVVYEDALQLQWGQCGGAVARGREGKCGRALSPKATTTSIHVCACASSGQWFIRVCTVDKNGCSAPQNTAFLCDSHKFM